MRKVLVRAGAVLGGGLAAVLLAASPASAHVTVNPSNATQGGYTKLTFRVPNEKDSATTTTLEVNLPQDTPIASVSVKPIPGWTATATKSKLDKPIKSDDGEITEAVTKIVWTANSPDAAIQVGQFQEFDVSVGPLPEVDKIVFEALQTYSDGDVVRWIEEPAADGKEPDHPAPTLKLAKAAADTSATDTAAKDQPAASNDASARSRADLGLGLGIAALVIALAGLVVGGLAWRRRPSA
jgi:periplasmic copper chaperone A